MGVACCLGDVLFFSDGLASPHQARVVCEAVQAGGHGADGGGQEAVLQCARGDLLDVVRHRRVEVSRLAREGVLVHEGPSS